ncbi:23S rRNA (uracil(1939)-C(5))-methyltransferase RlmD, partial [Patescibacteria group bacterium]|nr:23S rRNA (uracil(1939)-C(5))-methyltransferase RlmD [Patescibacteria group bacterium]
MKFGDDLQGRIERMDEKGRGVFTYQMPHIADGTRQVAVPFTTTGDEIDATFMKRDQGNWIASLKEVTHPSSDRVTAPCPHAGVCGGCLWQHMSYPAQLELKRTQINQALERAGHEERLKDVVPSTNTLHYRNRMDYVVGWQGTVGLKEYGSWNRYLDLQTCLLLDDATPTILQHVRDWMKEHELAAWDARRHTGLIRYCVIRLGKNTNERMVTIIVKDAAAISETARKGLTDRLAPLTTTLYLGENPEITDLSLAKTLTLLHGKEYLSEEVNGLRYLVHPNSFFQTNSDMAATLQTTVLRFLGLDRAVSPSPSPFVMDLYCGSGFFGIACAKAGARVYGHELDAPAIELAQKNAIENDVAEQATFGAGPAEDLDWKALSPDAVIIDPPRSGLHPRALEMLLEKKPPTIVYVS